MEFLAITMFALAVSADGFIVGVAYGGKKIRLPILPLLLIACTSTLAVTFSMLCGRGLAFLNSSFASVLGAIILILIGLHFLFQAWHEKSKYWSVNEDVPIITIKVKALGIIVQIIKKPSSADIDCSGEISLREAFFLALALAVDALGAGVGAALAGFNILYTALAVGVLKFILIKSGIFLGTSGSNSSFKYIFSVLPGIILITIGVMEFF